MSSVISRPLATLSKPWSEPTAWARELARLRPTGCQKLEVDLEHELDDSRSAGSPIGDDVVESVAAHIGVVLPLRRIHRQQVGQGKLRMIEQIEELRRELNVARFTEWENLLD